ncbi:MAG: nucleotide-binding protein [Pseudomonadota bacterium]
MAEVSNAMAKLSGIRNALVDVTSENVSRNRGAGEIKTRANFPPDQVKHYFSQAQAQLEILKKFLPDLYSDFQDLDVEPRTEMVALPAGAIAPMHFSRAQLERLVRDVDQIFEIRANSELAPPKAASPRRVFISHGRSNDWRAVQAFIEKDVCLATLELAQEPNMGRTIIEKLIDNSGRCDSAAIVMTGDDIAKPEEARVRENVMHEIGFFQGTYGRGAVVLLHEEGVNIPTNLSGVAYVPFPKGNIEAGFHVLQRELKAIYKL